MGNMSKDLLDMLTEFTVCELGSKVLDGITYTLLLKNNKDKEAFDRYLIIRNEAIKCGFSNNELFRVYELTNGYIFDMDMMVTKQITAEMAKAVARQNNGATPTGDLIKDFPEKRRKKDLVSLAKYLIQQFNAGKRQVEVALFSRNSTQRIVINGTGSKGEALTIRYNAYAIRHWDIELLNEQLLIPNKLRVSRIQPCEILPSKTGVSFLFDIEMIDE